MYFKVLLVTLSLLCAVFSSAQGSIAKIKYEEAEMAFEKQDYVLVLSKLEEAEKILGKSNPKILYLKVVALSRLIANEPLKDFSVLQNGRKTSKYFLTHYESLQGYEEKYR